MLENLLQQNTVYLQLARFFLFLTAGIFLTRGGLMPLTRKIMERRSSDRKARHSMENIVGLIGLFVSVTVALQAANFGNLVTILGTLAAAATVAIGFGMRDQIANVVAGIFIHTDNPFIKGDYIRVGENEGAIQEIKLRSTVLNGKNREKQVIPNNLLTTSPVKNFTKGSNTRIVLDLEIPAEHAEEAEEKLREIAEEEELVKSDPEPEISYRGIEEGKIRLELSAWTADSSDVGKVKDRILRKFSENTKFLPEKK